MLITYKNKRVEALLNSQERLTDKFGKKAAQAAMNRMQFLAAAPSLSDVPPWKPFKRHKLVGDRKNTYAVNIDEQFRITFIPHEDHTDLRNIREIEIQSVEDYH